MSRGTPDYGIPDYQVAIEQNDLSIFSLVESGFTFMDGKGRIIWYENFKQGLYKWNISAGGGGEIPSHIASFAYSYGFYGCVVLNPVVNGGDVVMLAQQNISFAKRAGLEVYMNMASNHGRCTFSIQVSDIDVHAYTAKIYVEEGTGDIYLVHSGGTTKIYDMPNNSYISNHWTNLKIVGDVSTGAYFRFTIGGNQIDVSAYTMVEVSTGIKGRATIDLRNDGKTGGNTGQLYIGGVLLSVDEP